jgi:hypothetical protein
MCSNAMRLMSQRRTTAANQAATPTETLLAHLDLAARTTAEIQDLYSRPIHAVKVLPLVTGEHRVIRVAEADAA